ncbi:MAG TPA: NUDIX hydrolase YfcD [Desulfobacteraceae bacterium]|nr:NUDIX hydrolase YfcD [Desulfobacteraceae bacterium]
MAAAAPQECVVIVDENNVEIAAVSRQIMRDQRLIHRASYVLVFNRAGELLVQQRTMTKDIYPGYYDIAAGGVVLAGESYEECAERELAEELGVRDVALRSCFDHYYADDGNRAWGRVFRCSHDGPFTLQKEEVIGAEFVPMERLEERIRRLPFTPDGLRILRRFLGGGG